MICLNNGSRSDGGMIGDACAAADDGFALPRFAALAGTAAACGSTGALRASCGGVTGGIAGGGVAAVASCSASPVGVANRTDLRLGTSDGASRFGAMLETVKRKSQSRVSSPVRAETCDK